MPRISFTLSPPWRVVLFLFAAAALNYADRAALSSVIPPLREDLGVTDVQVGIMGSLFLWSYALASPFAGNVADRFSRRRIVVVSLFAWSLITLLTGLANSVALLFFLRVALGLAESLYLPAAGALLGDHHGPATRGRAMGTHILGLYIGVLLGGAFTGLVAEHYGWRLGFWILGGLGMLLALISRYFLTDGPGRENRAEAPPPPIKIRAAYAYLVRVPSFHVMLVSAMVAGVASWIYLTWLPLYFRENFAMNLGAAGLTGVGLSIVPAAIGIALGGWISDKVARHQARHRVMVKALSFLVSSPFLFFFLGSPGLILVSTILVLSSIIRATGVSSEHPIICDIVPSQYRSTAIGILNTCGSAAGGLGVLVAGLLKKDWGLNTVFAGSSVLFILAGAVMLLSYYWFMPKDMARARAEEISPEPPPARPLPGRPEPAKPA